MSLPFATKEPLFISGVLLVFLTYSVAGVILPSLTTKYVAKKSMMVSEQMLCAMYKLSWKRNLLMLS